MKVYCESWTGGRKEASPHCQSVRRVRNTKPIPILAMILAMILASAGRGRVASVDVIEELDVHMGKVGGFI